jgi:uncharacterized membrane protein YeiB
MKKLLKIALTVFLILASILLLAFSWHVPSGEGLWQEESPDGRFTMTGYLTKGLLVCVSHDA